MNTLKTLIAILVQFQCLFLFSLAEIQVSLNTSGQFQLPSSEAVEFVIDNSSGQKVVQFDITININNAYNLKSGHFFLLICGKRIPTKQLISNIGKGNSYYVAQTDFYQIYMVDFDGLSLGSKTLSVFYSSTPDPVVNQLFAYALGPYEFGKKQLTYTGSHTQSYLSQYSVTTKRSCKGNCNEHGDCIEYFQNLSYCQCFSGFVGSDCGIPSKILVLDTKSNHYTDRVDLQPGGKVYLTIDFTDIRNQVLDQDFYLNIATTSDISMYSVFPEKHGQKDLTPDYRHWMYYMGYNEGYDAYINTRYFRLFGSSVQRSTIGEDLLVILFADVFENTYFRFGLSLIRNDSGEPDDRINNNPSKDNNNNKDSSKDNTISSDGKDNTTVILSIVLPIVGVGLSFVVIFYSIRKHLANRILIAEQLALARIQDNQERQNSEESLRRNRIDNNVELPPVQTYEYLVDKLMPAQVFNQNSNLLNNYVSQEKQKDKLDIDCAICTEFLSPVSGKVRKTICNHVFHSHCLMQWLNRNQSCPLCRRQLNTASLLSFQDNPHSYQDIVYIAVFPYRE